MEQTSITNIACTKTGFGIILYLPSRCESWYFGQQAKREMRHAKRGNKTAQNSLKPAFPSEAIPGRIYCSGCIFITKYVAQSGPLRLDSSSGNKVKVREVTEIPTSKAGVKTFCRLSCRCHS